MLGHTAKLIAVAASTILPAWIPIYAGRCGAESAGADSAGEASSLAGLATGLAASLLSVLLLFRLDSTRQFLDRAFLIPTVEFASLPAAEFRVQRSRFKVLRGMPKSRLRAAAAR